MRTGESEPSEHVEWVWRSIIMLLEVQTDVAGGDRAYRPDHRVADGRMRA
jgi:hypothetical protein